MGEGRLRRAAFGALTEAVNEQEEPKVPPVTLPGLTSFAAVNEQEEPKVPPVTLFLRFRGSGASVSERRREGYGGEPLVSLCSFTGARTQ